MINIRRGAFETNSSSMHCFIIANSYPDLTEETYGSRATIEENFKHQKRLVIKDIDFSHYGENDILETWFDKLTYVYGYNLGKCWDENINEWKEQVTEAVKRHYPEIEYVVFPECDNDDYYINHQSTENLGNFLDNHHLSWEDVVFDDRYVFVPTSDCYGYDDVLKELTKLGYGDYVDFTAWHTYMIVNNHVVDPYDD